MLTALLTSLALLGVGELGTGTLPTADPATSVEADDRAPEVKLSDEERELIELTNAERQRCGLRPLRPHPLLMLAAQRHAANMARQRRLSHVLDGKSVGDRLQEVGYSHGAIAENIAWNPASPAAAIRCWLASPGHRANILSGYDEIGVAVAINEWGERYWIQVFAVPAVRPE